MNNLNSTARLAGLGYLVIFATGFFANFFVLEGLRVPGNADATAASIVGHLLLFRWGLMAFALMVAIDILLAFPLYRLLNNIDRRVAGASSALRIVNGILFAAALYSLFEIARLAGMSSVDLNGRVLPLLETFDRIWLIGLIFFGLHLGLMGLLIVRSRFVPKTIGILLLMAGVGYLIDSSAQLFMPDYIEYASLFGAVVIVPAVVGELSLTVWLLVKGMGRRQSGTTLGVVSPI